MNHGSSVNKGVDALSRRPKRTVSPTIAWRNGKGARGASACFLGERCSETKLRVKSDDEGVRSRNNTCAEVTSTMSIRIDFLRLGRCCESIDVRSVEEAEALILARHPGAIFDEKWSHPHNSWNLAIRTAMDGVYRDSGDPVALIVNEGDECPEYGAKLY